MPRVVIDARSAVPRGGGIGTYVRDLVTHMLPIAQDFEFLLLRQPHHGEPLVRHERVHEAHYRGETKSVKTLLGIRPTNGFADYDLYHAPAEIVPLGVRCAWVVTIHDLMWLEAPRLASAFFPVRAVNALWYRFNTTRAIHGARRLIAISQATADAILRRFPQHAYKVDVVRHGVDRQRYSRARALPRSALDDIVPAHLRYSLIVGQGSPYKNHAAMLRAFVEATRDEPDHVLVMVRRFSRIDREMARLLTRSEIRKKMIVVPFVSDEVLLALMCHARALLFASLYEGFGLPALEAMALGVPVLGSTAAAVAEVVGEAALSAMPTDHDDLVAKIRALDGDEALRARLVEAGSRRAADFSWPRTAEQTLEVYRRAL